MQPPIPETTKILARMVRFYLIFDDYFEKLLHVCDVNLAKCLQGHVCLQLSSLSLSKINEYTSDVGIKDVHHFQILIMKMQGQCYSIPGEVLTFQGHLDHLIPSRSC